MKKALVTGGSGFIGSHLVDALVVSGVEVMVVDLVAPKAERVNASAIYVQTDIRDEAVRDAFLRFHPDVVFHLAAHVDDRASVLDPVMNAEHNVLGTLNVLEASRLSGARRFVFASTGIAYGNVAAVPVDESVVAKPLTPYAVSKLTGERYANCYQTLYGMTYMALRLGNVYGPRQDQSKECGAVAIFTRRLLQGEPVILNNDGLTTRDYVHVFDVVRAFMSAAEVNTSGVVNVGTGIETSTQHLYELVVRAVSPGLGESGTPVLRPEVQDMVKRCALRFDTASRELSWSPSISLEDGVTQTVSWYREPSSITV